MALNLNESKEEYLSYEFLFVKGRWKFSEGDPFYLYDFMTRIAHGKIENGLR
jgi:hypothetical protein